MPGRRSPNANIYKLLQDWFRNERNGNWLLISDNSDDVSFLVRPLTRTKGVEGLGQENTFGRPLLDYLPPCDHGSIIVTTRARDAGLQIADDSDIIDVQPMDREHSQMLLERKLGGLAKYYNQAYIMELATALRIHASCNHSGCGHDQAEIIQAFRAPISSEASNELRLERISLGSRVG